MGKQPGSSLTGIYCLPSCPSRRPRKSNAIFFDTCDQAECGGYRPCKKCQPRQGGASRLPEAVGWLAVAATQRGICLIEFADSKEEATARVEAELPRAERIELDAEFQGWVAQIVESMAVSGGKVRASNPSAPPLDLWGTAFQQRVWEALRAIPAGRTATYAEIAERLGQPKATRAVARACASNRVAVAIPCHRAVGSDGQLRGYKWGVERKRALLLGETENPRSKARIH